MRRRIAESIRRRSKNSKKSVDSEVSVPHVLGVSYCRQSSKEENQSLLFRSVGLSI